MGMRATPTAQSQHRLQGQAEVFLVLVTVGTKRPQDIAATNPLAFHPHPKNFHYLLTISDQGVTAVLLGKMVFLHLTDKGKPAVRGNSSVWGPQRAAMAGAQSPRALLRAPAGTWLCRATSSRAD